MGGGGVKIPLQSTKCTQLWRQMTPEVTGLPSLLPPLAAAKQAEDYKMLKYVFPFIQNQYFDKRRGVYLLEKVRVFIKIRVLHWPEISALGVSFNIDIERMRPPRYQSAIPPPPPPPGFEHKISYILILGEYSMSDSKSKEEH